MDDTLPAAPHGARWNRFAYAMAAAMTIGVGACMWGVPLPLTDNVAFLLEVQPKSLGEILRERFLATNYFRPFFLAQMKVLLSLANGHYFLAFRGFHVLQLAVTVLLFTRLLRVNTAASWAAFAIALMVLFGMHTLTISLIEGPLTAIFCCVAAVYLSFGDRPSFRRTALSALLLVYAALSVEIGLLVWVVYASAWIAGSRGLSGRAVALNTGLTVIYFVLRLAVLPSAEEGFVHRETGVGFTMMDPDDAVEALGGKATNLYAYNVASSIASVLLSEPRAGVWEFSRRYALGEVAPWQWIHLVSSAVTSLALFWYVARRLWSWMRLSLTRDDRIVVVFAGVLAASAVMSFAYTREAILGPAGVLFAMTAFVVWRAMLAELPTMRWPTRAIACALLVVASAGWSARAAGTTYLLRDAAFERRNDWALGVEYLTRVGHMPTAPDGIALVEALREDALAREVPSPRWAQPWIEEYVDRLF
jgi:hypothetical protein